MSWPTKKLGEVIEIKYGKGIDSSNRSSDGKYPIYGANGTLDYSNKFLVDGDAVIIGRKGSAGEITRVSGRFWPSDVTYYVLGNDKASIDYLLHLFKSLNLPRLAVGVKPGINRNRIYEIEIPLLSITEQKKIVAKLESVLSKIGEAKKLRAEAQENTNNLLSAELHKIFEDGKKKGWEEKELKEVCELNPKKSEIKNKANSFIVSFVPMKAVDEYLQEIIVLGERSLGGVRKGYTYFRDGDVLFAKITPCMENGKIAIAKNLKNGIGFGTTEFHVVRAKDGVLPEWIFYILRQPFFREAAKGKMTGSAGQKRVPVSFLETYKIPLPPLAEQKKIVARLDKLSQLVEGLRQAQARTLSDLIALEQSVLHQAFRN